MRYSVRKRGEKAERAVAEWRSALPVKSMQKKHARHFLWGLATPPWCVKRHATPAPSLVSTTCCYMLYGHGGRHGRRMVSPPTHLHLSAEVIDNRERLEAAACERERK